MNDILFIHLIYIYINDDEASGLWYVAEYDSKLATPSIPHDFNPTRIIILTIMLLCFYRFQCCASDSHFWFQMHCGKTKLPLGKDMHDKNH
ncbi:hypothetical protein T02_9637, partial [Trichinella nativa]